MSLAPFFPSPFSDVQWLLFPSYNILPPDSLCRTITLKYLDCMEAYGLHKSREKCAELYFDIVECNKNTFQKKRAEAIRKERMKQYREGKLEKPFDQYPPIDSFCYVS